MSGRFDLRMMSALRVLFVLLAWLLFGRFAAWQLHFMLTSY